MNEKMSQSFSVVCPACGSTQFQFDEDDPNTHFFCSGCNKEYTKDELFKGNQGTIDKIMKGMADKAMKDAAAKFRKSINDANRKLK